MSLGNTNIHQQGDIPEIIKLPNNRIRVVRRFQKFTREDVNNSNLGSLMGDFGALDNLDEQIPEQGYENCRLISVEVDTRFNAISNSDNAVLTKTYETLTSQFVEITDPTVEFVENGLKRITKVYRAISGTTSTNTVGSTTLSTGEVLASSKIEDNTAFAELTEIYLESGILSVEQEFNQPRDRITVRAFNQTSTEVDTALNEITQNHKLIAQSDDNFDGIKTSSYTYELDSHDVESTDENGLLTLTRSTILAASEEYTGTVGVTQVGNLFLANFSVQETPHFNIVTEEYIESGILSIDKDYVSEGVCKVTTTFLMEEETVVGPIVERSIGDFNGLKTISVSHMQNSVGQSLISNENPAVSHKILSNFTYPGTVRLNQETLTGSSTYSFSAVDYALESPVNAKVPARMEIYFKDEDTISYETGYDLWNPKEWAYGESKGIAWRYVPFSISRAFRGYRTTSVNAYQDNDYSDTGSLGQVGGAAWNMISGRRIFANTTFHIFVQGGPEDPVGKTYTLDYSVSEAFQDLDGTKYYKHIITKTDGGIPTQRNP